MKDKMRPAEGEWYIGIELGNRWTLVSCYQYQMKEPETRGLQAGVEQYKIPTAICKKKSIGQWYLGEEAKRMLDAGNGIYLENLLEHALEDQKFQEEEICLPKDVLLIFLKKVLRLVLPAQGVKGITKCVFSLEQVTAAQTKLLEEMAEQLGLQHDQLLIQDHRESFYAYAVSQPKELWLHDVLLFDDTKDGIQLQVLTHNPKTIPQVAKVTTQQFGTLSKDALLQDQEFTKIVQESLKGRIVSSVYLTGEGFEGGWMKDSLSCICRGHRGFQGQNLYTRGACYAGMLEVHQQEAATVYFCEYKTKMHRMLKVTKGEKEYLYPIVEAGKNFHEVKKSCKVLLAQEPVLDIWMQYPGSKEAVIESLQLEGLHLEEGQRCQLFIEIAVQAQDMLIIKITDIGFGSLSSGSGKKWEFEIEGRDIS
ncbi:MAG: DUF5716 family protein [Lachnospiraceae bacterium]